MNPEKPKIIFFGTPEFSVTVLDKLWDENYPIAAIITAPDALVGRKQILTPPPVKIWAGRHGIEVRQPHKLTTDNLQLTTDKLDLGVIAAYGKIIPSEILAIPKYGFLNVHPSLLPEYRGPTPIESAILAGEEKTGVTIHLTTAKMDAGPIVAVRELRIKEGEGAEELTERLSRLGAELITEVIPQWITGEIEPREQNDEEATYTKKFSREDGRISWEQPCKEIERKVRALGAEPGTFAKIKSKSKEQKAKTLKILRALPLDAKEIDARSGFFAINGKLAHSCKGGALLLEKVQAEGGRAMSGGEFLRGHSWIL